MNLTEEIAKKHNYAVRYFREIEAQFNKKYPPMTWEQAKGANVIKFPEGRKR